MSLRISTDNCVDDVRTLSIALSEAQRAAGVQALDFSYERFRRSREITALARLALAYIESDLDGQVLSFGGFRLPLDLVRMTGGGPETFAAIAVAHFGHVQRLAGIESHHTVLEVGCGIGRDAIPLTRYLGPEGRYVGVDIIGPSIDWCRQAISGRHQNFTFIHVDVGDQLHNPGGRLTAQDVRFPLDDGSVDRILLHSVFTHMFEADIRHYLGEFRRLLASDGRVYASWFIADQPELDAASAVYPPDAPLRFEVPWARDCRVGKRDAPAGAVSYTGTLMRRMVEDAGLRLEIVEPGSWPREIGGSQDVTVLALR